MKKITLFLFALLSTSALCDAQDLKTLLDYQYNREGECYSAYTAYLNNEQNAISLVLVANQQMDEIEAIKIKLGKSFTNVRFTKINVNVTNDDESINNLAVKLDVSKLIKEKDICETFISFELANGNKIQLPIKVCKLKEDLKV